MQLPSSEIEIDTIFSASNCDAHYGPARPNKTHHDRPIVPFTQLASYGNQSIAWKDAGLRCWRAGRYRSNCTTVLSVNAHPDLALIFDECSETGCCRVAEVCIGRLKRRQQYRDNYPDWPEARA